MDDDRRFRQFQLRHLLGLLTGAAVLFAVFAPHFRALDTDTQFSLSREAIFVAATATGITGFLVVRRFKVERDAGPLIERFERLSSRAWSWLIALLLWTGYFATIAIHDPQSPRPWLGSPNLLFFAVIYSVVRFWWRIDPVGIEARQRGLILGGFQLYGWDDVSRYSWSGAPPRQLNIFLKKRNVLNLSIDASVVERLGKILAERIAV